MDISITTMTAWAALGAGLLTSVHCVGMCGPLACSVTSCAKSKQHAQLESLAYHIGRILSYTVIGGLAGALGYQPLSYLFDSPAVILPWLMIPFIIITVFPGLIKLPRLKFLTLPYYRMKHWAQTKPPGIMGGVLGLISPCLPCTPLYAIFFVCLGSGSWLIGAKIALCFTLGTIPLLWVTQSSIRFITMRIPVKWRTSLKVIFVSAITILLTLRLQGTIQFSSSDTEAEAPVSSDEVDTPAEPKPLPKCCH